MKILYCECGSLVRPERVEAGFTNCIRCANDNPVERPKGVMIYTHKCAPEIEIMSAESWRKKKKYYVPNGARSALKNFSKNIAS